MNLAGMDVNALKEKAQRTFKSFSTPQLTIIGLLGVVTIIGGMAFMKWASAPSYSVLFSGLEPKDAQTITEQLKSDGVPYKLGADGSTVMVPAGKVYDSRLKLSAAGLPKGGTVGYDLLDKEGLTVSDFRQQVDYQRATEGEITRTLLAIDGVENATVHLAIPKDRLFESDREPARASVLLQTAQPLGEDSVQSV